VIKTLEIRDFGPIERIKWNKLGPINIVIGNNATGKTFLLKALYTIIKSVEETGRGQSTKRMEDILSERLYWSFQAQRLGDLVRKGAGPASLRVTGNDGSVSFQFGTTTEKKITTVENVFGKREANSVFLPSKEVLSLFHIIKKSRDTDQVFGFDDTYLDLVRAIEIEPTKGRNYEQFSHARKNLDQALQGRVGFEGGEWVYKQVNTRFAIYTVSEGIKKISILDRLLGNRYLSPDSLVFIDEPEAALHPKALLQFMEILDELSDAGIQFFLATHSYFVIKKLLLVSLERQKSMPLLSLEADCKVSYFDLIDGLPENPIIAESVELYKKEVEQSFK
jgi:AAA15 family ATPase/GTPase